MGPQGELLVHLPKPIARQEALLHSSAGHVQRKGSASGVYQSTPLTPERAMNYHLGADLAHANYRPRPVSWGALDERRGRPSLSWLTPSP